jgi:hypothetical protein
VSRPTRAPAGCLFAFGLPFVAIGTYGAVGAWHLYSALGRSRWALIMGGVSAAFLFVGLGLMVTALWGRKQEFTDESLRAQHPDQPWMWHPEWVSRRLTDRSSSGTFLVWGFALMWNAVASPALFVIPDAIHKGTWMIGFLVFPIVGLMLLANAIRLTLRSMRFRDSVLILDSVPVPIGGMLRGNVEVPHVLDSVSGVMIRLTGLSKRTSGDTTTSTISCHEERELDPSLIRHTADSTIIPIEMPVPADVPATDMTGASENVFWRLSVDAEVPGVDYSATFDVPVFPTAFSDFRPHGAPAPIAAPLQPKSFVEEHTPQGRVLHFARFRAPMRAFVSLLFATLWIGVTAFLSLATGVPFYVPILCGLIAIPLVYSTLELFFESHTIVLGAHDVTIQRRLFWKSETVIPYADIESASASTGFGHGARPYYRVSVITKPGTRVIAAKNIHSKREADWIASRIKSR